MRPGAHAAVCLASTLVVAGCGPSLRDACVATRAGEPLSSVVARISVTGAKHYATSPPAVRPDQHLFQKMDRIGLGAQSCYVNFDPSGLAVDIDYHEGN